MYSKISIFRRGSIGSISRRHRNFFMTTNEFSAVSSTKLPPYQHLQVEQKWQKYWDDHETFKSVRRPGKPKQYILDMFPYPSGAGLHVGHPEGYTATDIMARYYRMKDVDVLHPMGWDAFGLPAEQHAINTGTHPSVTTYQNIATFKRQLKSLGFSYDWSKELSTTDDNYVRWTQWIFLQLFKNGLAFQSDVSVNWCPALGTVLANEEVINGLSERGNHPVIRQPLRQWVLKITQYGERLEKDLENLKWPEGTLAAQKLWIGRSEGGLIKFPLEGKQDTIEVFTTRPDTLMGVTYVVLAPEHPLVASLTSPDKQGAVKEYQETVARKSDLERTSTGSDKGKTGVFLGTYATHPLSGKKVPIWIADYVLASYGTGAVMAVPGHDERDFEFAVKFNLPIEQVIAPSHVKDTENIPFTGEGYLFNSGDKLNGLKSSDAKDVIIKELSAKGFGEKKISYKLRDWIFSRQRYWGEPIPIYFPVTILPNEQGLSNPIEGAPYEIHYDQPIAVEEKDLPLKLPPMTDFHPGDDPQGCLARAKEWRFFQKEDGKWYARETNTMPQWAGSCWYYLRFTDNQNNDNLISKEASSWLPVDLYVGGQEHAVLHLLYARFWHKVLYDIGVVNHNEPFIKLVHQGMILGSDNEKMSKSRGNVINPDDVVLEHGADALRLYEMFMGPLEAVKPWQTAQLLGVVRFRDRVYNLLNKGFSNNDNLNELNENNDQLVREMHKTIKKVTEDIEKLAFNTAISTLMIYSNTLQGINGPIPRVAYENLILLLSPFAPHVAEECWSLIGHQTSLAHHPWPTYKEEYCEESAVTIAIQINGKVRGKVEVAKDITEDELVKIALTQQNVLKYTNNMNITKKIYVQGRILNLIVTPNKEQLTSTST